VAKIETLTPSGPAAPLAHSSAIMYSLGVSVETKRLVFISGIVGTRRDGSLDGDGSFAAQIKRTYENMADILATASCTFENVVKFTSYLKNAEDWPAYIKFRIENYPKFFPSKKYPPNTGLVVSAFVRPELLFEMEAIAAV
jgi:enamine deaminase RidA (YjgF/YER057c/UK114 family)